MADGIREYLLRNPAKLTIDYVDGGIAYRRRIIEALDNGIVIDNGPNEVAVVPYTSIQRIRLTP